MSFRERTDFPDPCPPCLIKVNNFVPLRLVADKVHLDCALVSDFIKEYLYDTGWQPFAHLIQDVDAIVSLEVHTAPPLLLDP